ncbi:Bug family tripartite tricarboxylate transporter substrate binding protein [Achromobacter aloeverae]
MKTCRWMDRLERSGSAKGSEGFEGRGAPKRLAGIRRVVRAARGLAARSLLGAAALGMAGAASAAYPDRPITLVVGYAPGGAVDVVARILGRELGEALGQTVVVENKPGFGGNLGAQYVKRAEPDGYTLLMAPTTSYALIGKLMGAKAVGYDLTKDFRPVALVGELPIVLVASHTVQAKTLPDFLATLKKEPGKIAYGSSGNGTIEHVVAEMFRLQEKVDIMHVPYRGAAPAMTDLMSGQIQMMFATAPTALANIPTGRVHAIGVASAQRLPSLPDVPTLAEQGLPDFSAQSLYGVLAPAATPEAVVAKLNATLEKLMETPRVKEQFALQGVLPLRNTPAEAARQLQADVAKWNKVIDAAGITYTP